ncbi:MAG: methyl-accepting chemotaxis protein [Alkalispirochaeta sp.]
MGSSIRTPLFVASGIAMLLLAVLTVTLSVVTIRREIRSLDRGDYSERIRNFEYDYRQVDAVSAATDEAYEIQQELMQELEQKYLGFEQARAYPFIVNGDAQAIMHLPESELSEDTLTDEIAPRLAEAEMADQQPREFTIDVPEFNGWVIASYYESWDWYTGYVMSDATRFAGVRRLISGLAMAVAAVAIVMFLGFGVLLNRLLRPVGPIERLLSHAQAGDLTGRLGSTGRGEVARIAAAVDTLLERFASIIGEITDSSRDTAQTGRELKEFADGALETFRGIGESTTTIADDMGTLGSRVEDSTSRVSGIADHLSSLKETVQEEDTTVSELSEAVRSMEQALQETVRRAQEAGESVTALQAVARDSGESVEKSNSLMQNAASRVDALNEFIELIHSIAEQTSLLAMNAAIEAAHAGDSGKGFAVVADEIQRLASSAEESSQNIGSVLKELVDSITQASRISRENSETFGRFDSEITTVSGTLGAIAHETATLESRHGEMVQRLESLRASSEHALNNAVSVDAEAREIRTSLSAMEELSRQVRTRIDQIRDQSTQSVSEIDRVQSMIESVTAGAEELQRQVQVFSVTHDAGSD